MMKPQLLQNNHIPQTLAFLKSSKFRSKFKLSEKDRQYIQDKGIEMIRKHAVDFIKTRIAPQNPKNDGKQTPMRGHPVFVAQHATATCCRGCIQKWHGIKKDRSLNDEEIDFLDTSLKPSRNKSSREREKYPALSRL